MNDLAAFYKTMNDLEREARRGSKAKPRNASKQRAPDLESVLRGEDDPRSRDVRTRGRDIPPTPAEQRLYDRVDEQYTSLVPLRSVGDTEPIELLNYPDEEGAASFAGGFEPASAGEPEEDRALERAFGRRAPEGFPEEWFNPDEPSLADTRLMGPGRRRVGQDNPALALAFGEPMAEPPSMEDAVEGLARDRENAQLRRRAQIQSMPFGRLLAPASDAISTPDRRRELGEMVQEGADWFVENAPEISLFARGVPSGRPQPVDLQSIPGAVQRILGQVAEDAPRIARATGDALSGAESWLEENAPDSLFEFTGDAANLGYNMIVGPWENNERLQRELIRERIRYNLGLSDDRQRIDDLAGAANAESGWAALNVLGFVPAGGGARAVGAVDDIARGATDDVLRATEVAPDAPFAFEGAPRRVGAPPIDAPSRPVAPQRNAPGVRIGEELDVRTGEIRPATPIDYENGSTRLEADQDWFEELAGTRGPNDIQPRNIQSQGPSDGLPRRLGANPAPDGSPSARVSDLQSRADPFGPVNLWDENQPPITVAEVRRAMQRGRGEVRDYTSTDTQGWSRQDHINRIATLARDGWADPIDLSGAGGVHDGLHRLAAAIVRGDETIATRTRQGVFGHGDGGTRQGPRIENANGSWQIVDENGAVLERLPRGSAFRDADAALQRMTSRGRPRPTATITNDPSGLPPNSRDLLAGIAAPAAVVGGSALLLGGEAEAQEMTAEEALGSYGYEQDYFGPSWRVVAPRGGSYPSVRNMEMVAVGGPGNQYLIYRDNVSERVFYARATRQEAAPGDDPYMDQAQVSIQFLGELEPTGVAREPSAEGRRIGAEEPNYFAPLRAPAAAAIGAFLGSRIRARPRLSAVTAGAGAYGADVAMGGEDAEPVWAAGGALALRFGVPAIRDDVARERYIGSESFRAQRDAFADMLDDVAPVERAMNPRGDIPMGAGGLRLEVPQAEVVEQGIARNIEASAPSPRQQFLEQSPSEQLAWMERENERLASRMSAFDAAAEGARLRRLGPEQPRALPDEGFPVGFYDPRTGEPLFGSTGRRPPPRRERRPFDELSASGQARRVGSASEQVEAAREFGLGEFQTGRAAMAAIRERAASDPSFMQMLRERYPMIAVMLLGGAAGGEALNEIAASPQ